MNLEQGGSEGIQESDALAQEARAEQDIYDRYIAFALRERQVPSGEKGSMEWVRGLGSFLQSERVARSQSRLQVAQTMGMPAAIVEYLELGLLFDTEITELTNPNGILERYASALNDPQLFERCRDQFGFPTQQNPNI